MGDESTNSDLPLAEFFTEQHRGIDGQWADVEAAADGGAAEAVESAWNAFANRLRLHLQIEEELMFPAFEKATGMTGGPTQVMRGEHTQMRALLDQMQQAVSEGDFQELVDQGDTLLMLIQQHNMKEEGMLYPMAEQALGPDWAELQTEISKRMA